MKKAGKKTLTLMLAVLLCMGNFGMSIHAFASESADMTTVSSIVSSDSADTGATDETTATGSGEELLNYYANSNEQTFTSAAGQVTFREIKDTDNLRIEGLRQKPDDLISAGEEKIDGEEIVNAIILLDAKSLLERGYEASEIPQSFWAGVIEDSLNRKQDKLADKVTSRFDEVEVNYYYTIGICGIGITTPYKNIEGLKKLSGVKDVILSSMYSVPDADESNQIIGAASAWEKTGYTGKGMKIAVIDTGLDLTHPNFRGGDDFETTKDSLTKEKISNVLGDLNAAAGFSGLTADKLYQSNKVPFAFNYIDNSLRVDHKDANGSDHGTHVAGIAAANQIEGISVCGVAPDAQVLVMKVFGNAGGAYFSDIMAAMEDAIRLECDSINISIGSSAGFTSDEQEIQKIFDRLCDTDVVVAVAAGNDYNAAYGNPTGTNANLTSNPDNGLITTPGAYANSTAVASMDNSADYFTVGNKNITFNDSAQQDTTKFMKKFSGGQQLDFAVVGNYGADISDFEEAEVSGKVALVQRGGEVTFMKKQENAQAAGAVAVIVYNSVDGTTSMKINDGEGNIPCISISKIQGEYMIEQFYENNVRTMTIGIGKTSDALKMSSFSSWGATPSLTLKPDITAVGGNVLSTVDNGLYGTKSGTSMASPQIAGAAALVKQYLEDKYPDISGGQLHARTNQLLMSTAIPCTEDNGLEFSPRKQGAGLLNVGNALGSQAYLSVADQSGQRPKAELGDDPEKSGTFSYTFQVSNLTGDSLAYELKNTLLTSGYKEETDKDSNETYYLLSDSDKKLDGQTNWQSNAMGLYYDLNDDTGVDTRDIRRLIMKENYSNRETRAADINGDGTLCDEEDIMLFLDNLSGVKEDLVLDREALIVPASGSASVTAEITISDTQKTELDTCFENGIYVEGYTYLDSLNEDGIGMSLPFMGFYGDWSVAPIFDAQNHHYSTEGRVNSYGTYVWTQESILGVNPYVETEYDPEHNAISDINTLDVFESGLLRNIKKLSLQVDDEKGKKLWKYENKYITKSLYKDSTMKYVVYRSPKLWEGTDEDGNFLKNNSKVTLKVDAQLDYKEKNQSFTYPITIDTEKPQLLSTEVLTDENGRVKLKASFKDNQYVAAVIFKSANGSVEYDRYAINQKEAGETISDYEFDVTAYDDDFMMIIADYAMNQTDYDVDLQLKDSGMKEPTTLDEGYIYGFNMGATAKVEAAMIKAPLNKISDVTTAVNLNGIYAAEYLDGYVMTVNALKELSIYTPQGTYWSQSKLGNVDCDIYDMAFNYTDQTLYAITYHDEKTFLSTIDIYNGKLQDIGPFGTGMTTLGCTTEGQLYGLSRAGELRKIDRQDASSVVVGKVSETKDPQWVSLNYRQSMAYDHNTGTMYWYAFCYNQTTGKLISHMSTIDLETAETKVMGQFDEKCEVTGLFIPYDGNLDIRPGTQVESVSLDKTSVALFPGQDVRIFASVRPWNLSSTEIEWTSDNPSVATVSSGRITAVSEGNANIKATVKGSNVSTQCRVKVIDNPQPFYGYQLLDWHDNEGNGIIQIDASNPIKYKKVANILQFVYAGEYVDGYYYCYDSNGYFYKIDTDEWIYTTIGKADGKVVEMSYDYATNTMYGISSTGHATALVRIDLNTGETSEIGAQDKKIVAMTSVPTAGNAQTGFTDSKLYAIDEESRLVTLSKETGKATVDPSSSKYNLPKVAYVQSMTYDYNTGYIYWAQVNQSQDSCFYILDLEEQNAYYAGVIGKVGSQVSGLISIPQEGKVPEIPYVGLEDIELTTTKAVMVKDGTIQLRAKTVPYNASSRGVKWISDHPDIVSVDAGGLAKANNEGTAVITCEASDEESGKVFKKTITIKVIKPIDSLSGYLTLDYETNAHRGWIGINPASPMVYQTINKSDIEIEAGTYYGGKLFAYGSAAGVSGSNQKEFYQIDPQTGKGEKLGTITHKVSDMTFDYSSGILYGITDDTDISIIDPSSGEIYPVVSQDEKILVTLAADVQGNVYAVGREAGSGKTADAALYKVNLPETAAGTTGQKASDTAANTDTTSASDSQADSMQSGQTAEQGEQVQVLEKIGETGQKALLAQSMIYDFESGYLYWAQTWAEAGKGRTLNLCIVDPATGYASVIGKIGTEGSEVTCLYSASPDEPEIPHVDLTGIEFVQGEQVLMIPGSEQKLQIRTIPVYASSRDFSFESEDESIAKVDKEGSVTARKAGTTNIIVTAKNGAKTFRQTIQIKVLQAPERMKAFVKKDRLFEETKNCFTSFDINDRDSMENYYDNAETFAEQIAAAEYYNGSIYAYTDVTGGGEAKVKFLKIDPQNYQYETINTLAGADTMLSDLTFDYSEGVMYGVTYLQNRLVQVDMTDGTWYEIGKISEDSDESKNVKITCLAADKNGVLYGITSAGELYRIDKQGKATLIKEMLLSCKETINTDLTWDPDTEMLYWSQSGNEQRVQIIDPQTGSAISMYPVGEEGADVSFLYVDSKTKLTVPESVTVSQIVLNNQTANVPVGTKLTLKATALPLSVSADRRIVWSSDNEKAASVDDNGNVTGMSAGTAVITAASVADGTVAAKCTVTVSEDTEIGYGYSTTDKAWVSFDLADPSTLTKVAEGSDSTDIACAAYAEGYVYAYQKSKKQLIRFNPAKITDDGKFTYENVGSAGASAITSLAYDPVGKKLYGATVMKMFTIDMNTGKQMALSNTFNFGLRGVYLKTLASNKQGAFYGAALSGELLKLDVTTGLAEYVDGKGKLLDGSTLNGYNNSMASNRNGDIYWAASSKAKGITTNVLNKVNLETGKVDYIGAFGGESSQVKISAMFIPTDDIIGQDADETELEPGEADETAVDDITEGTPEMNLEQDTLPLKSNPADDSTIPVLIADRENPGARKE